MVVDSGRTAGSPEDTKESRYEGGYIKLFRKIAENDIWTEDRFSRGQAWIDLILLANYKARSVFLRGIEVRLERGQLAWAITSLAKRWQWNKRTVMKFLKRLEKREMVHTRKNNITTIISIQNYDQYQASTQQSAQQGAQQSAHRQEVKESKKKEPKPLPGEPDAIPYRVIIEDLNQKSGKKYRHTTHSTQSHIKARWGEGFRLDDFKRVHSIKVAEWLSDPRMNKYIRPETLYASKFESYLNENIRDTRTDEERHNDRLKLLDTHGKG